MLEQLTTFAHSPDDLNQYNRVGRQGSGSERPISSEEARREMFNEATPTSPDLLALFRMCGVNFLHLIQEGVGIGGREVQAIFAQTETSLFGVVRKVQLLMLDEREQQAAELLEGKFRIPELHHASPTLDMDLIIHTMLMRLGDSTVEAQMYTKGMASEVLHDLNQMVAEIRTGMQLALVSRFEKLKQEKERYLKALAVSNGVAEKRSQLRPMADRSRPLFDAKLHTLDKEIRVIAEMLRELGYFVEDLAQYMFGTVRPLAVQEVMPVSLR